MVHALKIALVLIGACWAIVVAQHVPVWTSNTTLWAYAVKQTPQNPRVLLNSGRVFDLVGDVATAEARYVAAGKAAQADPPALRVTTERAVQSNLGHLALVRGDVREALILLEPLAQQAFFPGQVNYAIALNRSGRCVEADRLWTVIGIPKDQRLPCSAL